MWQRTFGRGITGANHVRRRRWRADTIRKSSVDLTDAASSVAVVVISSAGDVDMPAHRRSGLPRQFHHPAHRLGASLGGGGVCAEVSGTRFPST
jgi:hypothetical protein